MFQGVDLTKFNTRFGIAKMDGQSFVGGVLRVYGGSWQGGVGHTNCASNMSDILKEFLINTTP